MPKLWVRNSGNGVFKHWLNYAICYHVALDIVRMCARTGTMYHVSGVFCYDFFHSFRTIFPFLLLRFHSIFIKMFRQIQNSLPPHHKQFFLHLFHTVSTNFCFAFHMRNSCTLLFACSSTSRNSSYNYDIVCVSRASGTLQIIRKNFFSSRATYERK